MHKKKSSKTASKLLAAMLAAAMSLTLLPTTALAVEGSTRAGESGLVLNKTATLEDDGTYTIKLEAYAKGEVTTTTVKEPVPTDVILVLDQSGSMDKEITGIPSDTYSQANPTNKQVVDGTYYYKVGDIYYPVTATRELVNSSKQWVGDDGKIYTADQLSYSWNRKSDGQTYYTARPFVTSSLSTWTRSHTPILSRFYYVNDVTKEESNKRTSAKSARENFETTYAVNGYTVEFHNDGNPGTSTEADDPYYCAAVYIAVTQKEVNEYRYVYTYIDNNGNTVTIGRSDSGTESAIDAASCAINPLYTRDTTTGTRLDALQYAANHFIDDIRANALANNIDHRVAVIGFASSGTNYNKTEYENTELFVGASQYPYNGTGTDAPSAHYNEALQSVNTSNGYANLQASVTALDNYGGTYPQYGFDMANGVFDKNTAAYTKPDGTEGTRSRVVIFMTDGEPGSGNGVNQDEANATIRNANISKNTYSAKVYSVAVLDSAPTSGGDQDNFLKNVSSDNKYTLATSTEALEGFFKEVSKDISTPTTSVTLSEDSRLVDELSSYFVVPNDFSLEGNVSVQTAVHAGYEAFNAPAAAPENVNASLRISDGKIRGVAVSGFNFVSPENIVTTSVSSGGSTIASGNKLVVTITGLLAKDEAATGTYVDTNTDKSGIWDWDENGDAGMIKAFPVPHTMLDKKLFVLDYAKKATLDVYNASRVDSALDGLFSKVNAGSNSLTASYGEVSTAGGLSYTPTTTNWNGYDSFYALGKDATVGDVKTQNIWSKISVLPANNVYFEDTFESIVYSDGWEKGQEGSNNVAVKNDSDNAVHGWIDSMADDAEYSDGTAACSNTENSTATFTFTGTGVDVYSRTNDGTGYVKAQLSQNEKLIKSQVVNSQSVSGDYYQIPTISFSGLKHGTYTVKLTVGTDATYYLDGIRVYNPLSETQENDSVVSVAYGDEIGATFMEVRDILIDAEMVDGELPENAQFDGAVFLDKLKEVTSAESYSVAEYEDYGPKNEVYLSQNQAIVFNVSDLSANYYIGLKAPGGATEATVTNDDGTKTVTINAASDLYYKVVPSRNGMIEIKNTSGNLLSITKLRRTGDASDAEVFGLLRVSDAVAYANSFDSLSNISDEDNTVTKPEKPEISKPDRPEHNKPQQKPGYHKDWFKNLFHGFGDWFRG